MKKLNVFIIPTSHKVMYPYQNMRLRLQEMQYYDPKQHNNYVGLVPIVENEMEGVKRVQRLSQYGTLVRLTGEEYTIYSSNRVYTAFSFARFKIESISKSTPYFLATVELLTDDVVNEQELYQKHLVQNLKSQAKTYLEFFSLHPNPLFLQKIDEEKNINKLFYTIATHAELSYQQKLKLLQMDSHKEKFQLLMSFLKQKVEEFASTKELEDKVKKELLDTLAKQQAPPAKKQGFEFPYSNRSNDESSKLEAKLKNAKLPEHVKEIAEEEIKKLKSMGFLNAESNVSKNYVELILALPWDVSVPETLSIDKCKEVLDKDHFGLVKVKERILQFLAVKNLTQDKSNVKQAQIICFHGPPGVGKTSLGKSIADSLNRPFHRIALGGMSDEAQIRGHRRTYIGALPGALIQAVKKTKCKNPVILLDEIDKLSSSFRGDPSSALLEVLDPEQNSHFMDNYLNIEFDLSQVLFITTANSLEPIQPALRDRLEMIELPGYTLKEKVAIANTHLIPKLLTKTGITSDQVELPAESIQILVKSYTAEAGVRQLERVIAQAFRNVALKLVKESSNFQKVVIDKERITEIMGPSIYSEKSRSPQIIFPGIAKGLAWTPSGGKVLMIETVKMEGKGRFEITGMLGDIMKESVRTAIGLIKANWPQIKQLSKYDTNLNFDTIDIHIHFPAGAIPKDGPSAGIAITTAIVSLLTGQKVKNNIAMTGEVTLTGRVLPVGGIKEKLLGAYESGITTVIIPHMNKNNLTELDPEIKEKLIIHTVKSIDEVFYLALEGNGSKIKTISNLANL